MSTAHAPQMPGQHGLAPGATLIHALAKNWWLEVLRGVAAIVFGILAFAWPGITAFILLFFIAGWAIVLGIFEIIGAIRLRKEIEGEWLLILNGAISVLFGLLLLWRPGVGALAVVWIIGAYAILLGIIYVIFGLKLRKHASA